MKLNIQRFAPDYDQLDVTYDHITKGDGTKLQVDSAIRDDEGYKISTHYAKKNELPTVNNATLTIQKNGTTVKTFTANASSNVTANITVPTKTSDLTNDDNVVKDASYVHTDNNYTTTEKNKLSGIASGAEVNVQANWTETNTSSDAYIKNKPTIPTQTSQLTNNSGFITKSVNNLDNYTLTSSLASVATSGSYNDLSNKPTIPTVNNATLTIQKNGTTVNTFTANASSNVTANITVPTKTSDLTNDSEFIPNKSIYVNTHPENNPVIIPFINNDISFLKSRGGSYIVKYDGTTQSQNIDNVFDGSPSYWSINPTGTTEIVIELTLHKSFGWTNTIYYDFGSSSWRAKNIKVEVMNSNYASDTWVTKQNLTNYGKGNGYVTTSHTPVGADNAGAGFNKIRFTFSSWQTATGFRISQLGVYNYGSLGVRETYMSRGIDDYVLRNITPNANNSYNLGSSDKKWASVYATTFNGNLTGNVTGIASSSYNLIPQARVGSDVANTSGWYKVADCTMSGWGNQNILYYVKGGYTNGYVGLLDLEMRSDNTSISCWKCRWLVRHPNMTENSVKIVISGMKWTMYAYNPSSRYGRIYFTELTNRNIQGNAPDYTIYYHNTTVPEETEPSTHYVSQDAGIVERAKCDKNGNDITTTYQPKLTAGTNITIDANNVISASGGGGTATDVQVNGTSITSGGVANLVTQSAYNSSTNKIATKNDIPTNTNQLTNGAGFITKSVNNLDNYTKTSSLASVATSGSYNDLSNKPTIPTVNNGTLTIQKNGTNVQTFTANQSTNVTANITVPTQTSNLTNNGSDGNYKYLEKHSNSLDYLTVDEYRNLQYSYDGTSVATVQHQLSVISGTNAVTKISGNATVRESNYYQYGKVVEMRLVLDTTASTSAGSNVFQGTIKSALKPMDYVTGVGFNGGTIQVGQISPDGEVLIRNCVSSLASGKATGIHFTYLIS